ncbi:MAG: L protein [Luposicya lupus actinovirus]|nr:MAG: L protein [Luposicya lupus actinovirus]
MRAELGSKTADEEQIALFLERNNIDDSRLEGKVWENGVYLDDWYHFKRKTPDIMVMRDENKVLVVEVTVTTRVNSSRAAKLDKYEKGLREMSKYTSCDFELVVVSVFSDGSNLDSEWPGLDWKEEIELLRQKNDEIKQVQELTVSEEREALRLIMSRHFGVKEVKPLGLRSFNIGDPDISKKKPREAFEEVLEDVSRFIIEDMEKRDNFPPVRLDSFQETVDATTQKAAGSFETKRDSDMWGYFLFARTRGEKPQTMESQKNNLIEVAREMSNGIEEGDPAEGLFKGIMPLFESLNDLEWDTWFRGLGRSDKVPDIGCLKPGHLSAETKSFIDHSTGKDREKKDYKQGMVESLPFWDESQVMESIRVVRKTLDALKADLETPTRSEKVMFGNTRIDVDMSEMFNNETKKRILDPVGRSRGWSATLVLRDMTEWATAQSGNKRSKKFSAFSACGGDVVFIKLPGKSTEVLGGQITIVAAFRNGCYMGPKSNIMGTFSGLNSRWSYLKPVTLDLKRLEAMGSASEKTLVLLTSISTKYAAGTSQLPEFRDMREMAALAIVVSSTPKMKVCGALDFLRYLIFSAIGERSGCNELSKSAFSRPCTSDFDVWLRAESVTLVSNLISSRSSIKVQRQRVKDGKISKSRFGAVGDFPLLGTEKRVKTFSTLVAQVNGLFFMCPKGLHGRLENLKIVEETIDWQALFEEREEKYGDIMTKGYKAGQIKPEQQLFCSDVSVLAADWVNKQTAYKKDEITGRIGAAGLTENYYRSERNRSTKGTTGDLDPEGNFTGKTTLEDAISHLMGTTEEESVVSISLKALKSPVRARLVRKFQRTAGDRGIFIVDRDSRAKLQSLEKPMSAVAKSLEQELISVPGEAKIPAITAALEKALKWAAGKSQIRMMNGRDIRLRRKLTFVSGDATKWSPGDNSKKYKEFFGRLVVLDPKLRRLMQDCCDGIYETDLGMMEGLSEMLGSMQASPLTDKLRNFYGYPSRRSGRIRGNWLQGNLNFTSSVYGTAVLNIAGDLAKEIWGALDLFYLSLNHSDDSLTIIGSVEPVEEDLAMFNMWVKEMGPLYRPIMKVGHGDCIFRVMEYVAMMGCIKLSTKKTVMSNSHAQFVGFDFEGGQPVTEWVKLAMASLTDIKVRGYYQDLSAVVGAGVKVLDMSGSAQVAQLIILLGSVRVQRAYGVSPGMVNYASSILKLRPENVFQMLGSTAVPSIFIAATGGMLLHDLKILSNAVDRPNDEQSIRVFKVMKAVESMFKDEVDKNPFGSIDWKIFYPKKKEIGISEEAVKVWLKENPVFAFLTPELRADLLMKVAQDWYKPEVQASMVRQSDTVLRFRLMSRVNGDVVKVGDEWMTFRKLLFRVAIAADKADVTLSDLQRWRDLKNNVFSKSLSWAGFFNETAAEVTTATKRSVVLSASRLVVREESLPIYNTPSQALAFAVARNKMQKMFVERNCRDKAQIASDADKVAKALRSKINLRLEAGDLDAAKKALGFLRGNDMSRTVLAPSNMEPTASGIVTAWIRNASLTRVVRVTGPGEVLKGKNIFSKEGDTAADEEVEALKLAVAIWRFTKVNGAPTGIWLRRLAYKKRSLSAWMNDALMKSPNPSSDVHQAASVMFYDLYGEESWAKVISASRLISGKRYLVSQTFNQERDSWEGDLELEMLYGRSLMRLKVDWETKKYEIETAIRDPLALSNAMSKVREELKGAGMELDVFQAAGNEGISMLKRDNYYLWARPRKGEWVVDRARLNAELRDEVRSSSNIIIEAAADGWTIFGRSQEMKRSVKLISGLKHLSGTLISALEATGDITFDQVRINELVSAGLLPQLLMGLPAKMTKEEASKIMMRQTLSRKTTSILKCLRHFTGENVELDGIDITVGTGESWGEEEEIEVDLDDIDFDVEEDESTIGVESWAEIMEVTEEAVREEKVRGVVKYDSIEAAVKKWVTRDIEPGYASSLEDSVLLFAWINKNYEVKGSISRIKYWELVSMEAYLGPLAEYIVSYGIDDAAELVRENPDLLSREPDELRPTKDFQLKRVKKLLDKLFRRKFRDFYGL